MLAAVHNGDNPNAAAHHTSIALIHRGTASEHTNDNRHTAAAASHSKSAVSHTNAAKSYALAGDTVRAELSRKAAAASRAAAAASHTAAALEHANNQRHAAAAASQEAAARSSTLAGDHKVAEVNYKAAEASHRAAAAAAKHEDEKRRLLLAMAEASKHKAEAAAFTALGKHADAATSLQHAGDAFHAADRTRDAANTYYHAAISSTAAANAHVNEDLARKSREHAAELHAKSAETHSSIKNFKFAEANQRMAQALHTKNGNTTAATVSKGLANEAKSKIHPIAIPNAQSAPRAPSTRAATAVTRHAGSASVKVADPKHAVPPHAGSANVKVADPTHVLPPNAGPVHAAAAPHAGLVHPNATPHAGPTHANDVPPHAAADPNAEHTAEMKKLRHQAAAEDHKKAAAEFIKKGNNSEAAKSFAAAAAAHAAIGEHEHEATSRSSAAEHHDLAGEHDHAAAHHDAAAAIRSRNGMHAAASASHTKAAESRRKKGDDKSMKLAEASEHKAQAAIHAANSKHSEAAESLSKAADVHHYLGDHAHAAAIHTAVAEHHALAGEHDSAAASHAKAAAIHETMGDIAAYNTSHAKAAESHTQMELLHTAAVRTEDANKSRTAAQHHTTRSLSTWFTGKQQGRPVVNQPIAVSYTASQPIQSLDTDSQQNYNTPGQQPIAAPQGVVPYSTSVQQQNASMQDVSYDPGQPAGPMQQPLGDDLVQNIEDVKTRIGKLPGLSGVASALDVILEHRDLINPDERLRNAIAALQNVKLAVQEKLKRGSQASTGADDALYLEIIAVLNSLLMAVSQRGIQINEQLTELENSIGQLKAEADAP